MEDVAVADAAVWGDALQYTDALGAACDWRVAGGALVFTEAGERAPPAKALNFVVDGASLRLELGVEAWHSLLPRQGLESILGHLRALARAADVEVCYGDSVQVPSGSALDQQYVLETCLAAFNDSLAGLRSSPSLGWSQVSRDGRGGVVECVECKSLAQPGCGVYAAVLQCWHSTVSGLDAAPTAVDRSVVMQAVVDRWDEARFRDAAGSASVLQVAAAADGTHHVVLFKVQGDSAEAAAGELSQHRPDYFRKLCRVSVAAFAALVFLQAPGLAVVQSVDRLARWDTATGTCAPLPRCWELRHVRAQLSCLAVSPPVRSALVLGLGGGSVARACTEVYPDARVVGVELEPAVAAIAREHFGLPESVEVAVADAAAYAAQAAQRGERHTVVFCDAYGGGADLPESVAADQSRFYADCAALLDSGGVLTANVVLPNVADGAASDADALEAALRPIRASLPPRSSEQVLHLHSRQAVAMYCAGREPLQREGFDELVREFASAHGLAPASMVLGEDVERYSCKRL